MRTFFILACLLLTSACDAQKTAAERTEDIETFADPAIDAYHRAQKIEQEKQAAEQQRQRAIDSGEL